MADAPLPALPEMIQALKQSGFSYRNLSILWRCSPSTIGSYATGKSEPRRSVGLEIEAMYLLYCRKLDR